jgi:ribonuclease-3
MSAVTGLEELEADLGYHFREPALLHKALTHSSHAHEHNHGEDNEQLEFLGDAILGFVVSDLLYRAYPSFSEGQLSKLKGFFVSAANLVKYAEQLKLGRYLHLGRGEEKTGGRTKQALLVDAFEAILGAMYLDSGPDAPGHLISRFAGTQIADIGSGVSGGSTPFADFKTALQELLQSRSMEACHYVLIGETGPDHQKLFTVDIEVGAETIARGIGLTRRAAEQAAARRALEDLNQREQDNWPHDRGDVQEIDRTGIL